LHPILIRAEDGLNERRNEIWALEREAEQSLWLVAPGLRENLGQRPKRGEDTVLRHFVRTS
jgi:hypothetical protein